jgi:outer membrane protein TolC
VTRRRSTFRTVAAIAVFVAFANARPVSLGAQGAQITASSADTLTLEHVIAGALRENPELRSAHAGWEAMRERPALERTLPNPMFKYGGMDMTRGGNWPNTDEKRFMVEQEFPWFGKLGLRGQVAAKEAETMQREYEAMQREVIWMVKESYFDLYGVQHSLSITRAEKDVLERVATVAITKYSTGEVTQQDVLKAQAEISMVREKLYDLEQQEAVLKARINQLLNRRPDSPLGMAVTPPADAFDLDLEELFTAAKRNRPEIKSAQAQIEGSEAERELMKKESFPDYRLGVEYRSFRAGEDMVMFTVGFDLPIWRGKYKAGVREAEKMIESSKAAKEAAEKQAAFDVADAHFKLLAARRTLDLYKNVLIPQAQARFDASEAGYGTGKVDFLDLLESERFLLNARVTAAMTEGSVGMQAARLERAIGTDLKPAAEPEGEKP